MHDILDLDSFPLHRSESPEWNALVDRCRNGLERDGMFNLHGFVRPGVAGKIAGDLAPLFDRDSFLHEREHNIYFTDPGNLPSTHPALARMKTSNRTLCADQITGSPLLKLYEWPEFARFLAATMQMPALHVMDDPLARVNVMSYGEGQALNWHFDRSEFTTTLLLQAPDDGGVFEYRTALRRERDPNADGVARLLRGQDPDVRSLTLTPGTLNVFRGRNTAHRVTPVHGATNRVIAVFSFFAEPGVRFSEAERRGFYGRT